MKLVAEFSAFSTPSWAGLVNEAVAVAGARLERGWTTKFVYHDLAHTASVIYAADLLAADAELPEDERALLIIAAAFHDSGYYDDANNHENLGATYAAEFLIAHEAPVKAVGRVVHLIQSTAIHARPVTPLQQLLRDADLHYLGMDGFLGNAERLRREWELTKNLTYSETAWMAQNVRFMEAHRFHSSFAEKRFGEKKAANLVALKAHLAERANG